MHVVAYFEIQSSDPEREIKFYQKIFGWEFIREYNVPVKYYRIVTNGIHGGLLERPAKQPPPGCGANAFTCSVEVKNFDAAAKQILNEGGATALPKFAIPGRCWQGYFTDPDNNTFGIFETDLNAR